MPDQQHGPDRDGPPAGVGDQATAVPRRVALVTGGSRGIGAAIAVRLAADGYDLVVDHRADREAAEEVVGTIAQQGGRAISTRADVTDPGQVHDLFDLALERYGRLDVVVLDAGIGHSAPISETGDADYEQVFATNTRAVFDALREAAHRLNDGGRVVVISRSGLPPSADGGLYAASKAAGDVLVRAAAQELGPRGITVNSVAPGAVRTDLWAARSSGVGSDEAVAARIALRRLAEPDDIADVVAFLASEAARYVTGATIAVDGGLI